MGVSKDTIQLTSNPCCILPTTHYLSEAALVAGNKNNQSHYISDRSQVTFSNFW